MPRRPRLGFHCPGVGAGGPWRYLHSLLRHVDLIEFDVRVFCDMEGVYEPRPEIPVVRLSAAASADGLGAAAAEPATAASSVYRRWVPREVKVIAGFGRSAWRLSRILKPHRLDLFHTMNAGCEYAPLSGRLAGAGKVVGTFHVAPSTDLSRERDGLEYRFLERVGNGSLDLGIAVSNATSRDWRRRTFIPRPRITVIPNGVDAAAFSRKQSREEARKAFDIPADAFVVAGLGRLDSVKGFADLLDAAALARSTVPKLVVILAGEGPLRLALEAHAESRGILKCVRFPGFLKNVQPVLDAADLFALPSLSETFGYAAAEAMAAGLPVLGSDVGGVREVIRDGETGLVLPPQSPAVWATSIRTLANNASLRERMGRAGQERVRTEFTDEAMVKRTFAEYCKLLAR